MTTNLSTQIRKSYTYLILFYDGSFYYGVRICPKGKTPWQDVEYVGSPVTHKDKWNKVKFTKFILEVFDDYKSAQEKEKKLIRPNLNNPACLNENIGGIRSLFSCSKGGKKSGIFAKESGQLDSIRSKESSRKGGETNKKSGQIKELGKKWGKINGRKAVESGHLASIARMGGKKTGKDNVKKLNSQRWKCLITGYITSPGALSKYQSARGIDTSLRERIE